MLSKPGALTAEEWALVRKHPLLGVSILKQVPRMEAVVPVILQHHERYDGQGYPDGLLGDDSPRAGPGPGRRRRLRGDDLRPAPPPGR